MQLIPMGLVTEENHGGNSLEENLQGLFKDCRAFAMGALLQWLLENHSDTCKLGRESPHRKEKKYQRLPLLFPPCVLKFPYYPPISCHQNMNGLWKSAR